VLTYLRVCTVNVATGFFVFFIFIGLSVLLLQLIMNAMAFAHKIQDEKTVRRLRYVRGGEFVELPPLTKEDFAHLPGLEPSPCFHLFLSRELPPSLILHMRRANV
jgi:hypothetical protein